MGASLLVDYIVEIDIMSQLLNAFPTCYDKTGDINLPPQAMLI